MIENIDLEEAEYLYIAPSKIPEAGNGLFTAIKIYKDERIAIYHGEVISNEVADSRANKAYFMILNKDEVLDCYPVDGFAKYANDVRGTAYKPNAEITLDEEDQVCLKAIKNIQPHEEILCSYGKKYWT